MSLQNHYKSRYDRKKGRERPVTSCTLDKPRFHRVVKWISADITRTIKGKSRFIRLDRSSWLSKGGRSVWRNRKRFFRFERKNERESKFAQYQELLSRFTCTSPGTEIALTFITLRPISNAHRPRYRSTFSTAIHPQKFQITWHPFDTE